MTSRIRNTKTGVVVDIGGEDISITANNGTTSNTPFPTNGVFFNNRYTYDYDLKGNSVNFVLVYSSEIILEGSQIGANFAQFYNWQGQTLGDPIYLTSQTNSGHRPGIGVLKNGDYIAMWQTNNPLGYPELGDRIGYIVGRYIKYDGSVIGETFIIATGTILLEEGNPPSITQQGDQIIVSWSSYSSQFGTSSVTSGSSGDISKTIKGSPEADTWYTFEGNDKVYGYAGDDYIDAGSGNNNLYGGKGNDIVITQNGNDKIDGGTGDDILTSGDGNDTVIGGGGSDIIIGGSGAGNDKYDGGSGRDLVKYLSATSGIIVDLSKSSSNASSLLENDAAGIGIDSLKNIEDVIAGNYDDIIIGNSSANSLSGEDGSDVIKGGRGNDNLIGGNGADRFVFDTTLNARKNLDRIDDFQSGSDKIVLENAIFKKFNTLGSITESNLVFSDKALSGDDFLIYHDGTLFYDADGVGAGKPVAFAILVGSPTLLASDFEVI